MNNHNFDSCLKDYTKSKIFNKILLKSSPIDIFDIINNYLIDSISKIVEEYYRDDIVIVADIVNEYMGTSSISATIFHEDFRQYREEIECKLIDHNHTNKIVYIMISKSRNMVAEGLRPEYLSFGNYGKITLDCAVNEGLTLPLKYYGGPNPVWEYSYDTIARDNTGESDNETQYEENLIGDNILQIKLSNQLEFLVQSRISNMDTKTLK